MQVYEIIKQTWKTPLVLLSNEDTELLLESLNEDPSLIAWINSPTEEMQLSAIRSVSNKDYKDGKIIGAIKNRTYNAFVATLQKDGDAIVFFNEEEQTEEFQLLAVQQNQLAIRYIKKPTDKVRKVANTWNF